MWLKIQKVYQEYIVKTSFFSSPPVTQKQPILVLKPRARVFSGEKSTGIYQKDVSYRSL